VLIFILNNTKRIMVRLPFVLKTGLMKLTTASFFMGLTSESEDFVIIH
jgi:hypothetical protein